jgi:hypothetical protein
VTRISRVLLFVALAIYIALGPALAHIFGIGRKWARGWRMFESSGSQICKVEYWAVKGGRRTPLDRFRVLGFERREAPRWLRLVPTGDAAVQVGRRLCTKLGREADVRALAVCGHAKGWREEQKPHQNLCAPRGSRTRRP